MPHFASSIPRLISKKDEILDSPCVTHPLIKSETRKMWLQLALKLLFPPCDYPPPIIKVLQTTKISKLGLLSLSAMILNDHCSPHTLNYTIRSSQTSPGGTWTGSFSIPLFPIKSPQARFLKSPQVRYAKVQPSLKYVPVNQVSYQKVPMLQIAW